MGQQMSKKIDVYRQVFWIRLKGEKGGGAWVVQKGRHYFFRGIIISPIKERITMGERPEQKNHQEPGSKAGVYIFGFKSTSIPSARNF